MKGIVMIIKSLMCLGMCLLTFTAQAQIGIRTNNPESVLDVRSSSQSSPTNTDGLLMPVIDAFPLTSPTGSQDGMLIYHKGNTMQAKGFYYWEQTTTSWVYYGGVKKIHELKDGNSYFVNTTDGASVYLGANSIMDFGYANLIEEKNTAIGYNALFVLYMSDTPSDPATFLNNTTVGYGSGSDNFTITGLPKTFTTTFGLTDHSSIIDDNNYLDKYSDFNHAIKQDGETLHSVAIGYAYGAFTPQILPYDGLYGNKNFAFIGSYFSTYNFIDTNGAPGESQYQYYYDWVGLGFDTKPTFYNSNILKLQSYANGVLRGVFNNVNYNVFSSENSRPTIALGYRQLNGFTLYPASDSRLTRKQNISLGYLAHENSGTINNNNTYPTNWNNIALGANALYTSSDTNYNIAIGNNALLLNTGNENIAIGKDTMNPHNIGDGNTAIGSDAFRNNYEGTKNVALGKNAGYNVTGNENTFVGVSASNGISAHFKNGGVNIGAFSGYLDTNDNRLYIENSSGTTPLIGGDFDLDRVGINRNINSLGNTFEVGGDASKSLPGSWLGNSDRRLKKNILNISSTAALSRISKLNGVSYFWNDTQTGNVRPEEIQYGFIAQDLMQVFPEHVTKDNQGFYQTAYGTYDAFVVEAIKELQTKFEVNDSAINDLDERLKRIENLLLKANRESIQVANN